MKVIQKSRYISWDIFKKQVIASPLQKRPINRIERFLFLNSLFKNYEKSDYILKTIPQQYNSYSYLFIQDFIEILPILRQVCINPRSVDPVKLTDFREILHKYDLFLANNNLFEPSNEISQLKPNGSEYLIFFPEVIDDFEEYRDLISKAVNISTVSVDAFEQIEDSPLHTFETSIHECKWLFNKIYSLLKTGIPVEDIAITACNIEEIESHIKLTGTLFGIPLTIHKGKKVSSLMVSRVFQSIRDIYEDNFSLRALKGLLLNNSVPWKDRATSFSLIDLGIRYKCVKDSTPEGSGLWESSFKKAARHGLYPGQMEKIEGLYKSLVNFAKKINKAASFEELKNGIEAFLSAHVRQGGWDREQERILQFSLSALDELSTAEKRLSGIEIPDHVFVFLNYLEQVIYVSKTGDRAIPVYPYRVSAGIVPKYHFIVNASQAGMKYRTGDFSYLSEYEKSASPGLVRDFTDHFFSLYLHSGENVIVTHSREGFDQRHVIPPYYIIKGDTEKHTNASEDTESDPCVAEELMWLGHRPVCPGLVSNLQKTGFASASATGFAERKSDYSRDPVKDADLSEYVIPRAEKEGVIHLSSTSLEKFVSCPFHWFLEKVLGIEETDWDIIRLDDPKDFGTIMHAIFQKFYQYVIDTHGGILPPDVAATANLMKQIVVETTTEYKRLFPVPVTPVWSYWIERFFELSEHFVRNEIREYGSAQTLFVEEQLKVYIGEGKILLNGKIDRISECCGKLSIIDYKKKKGTSQKAIFSDSPSSFQIPFYVYLAETSTGKATEKAGYYLMEEGKYSYVFDSRKQGKETEEAEKIASSVRLMLDIAGETAARIRRGDFTVNGQYGNAECGTCAYRGVCRNRFLLNTA